MADVIKAKSNIDSNQPLRTFTLESRTCSFCLSLSASSNRLNYIAKSAAIKGAQTTLEVKFRSSNTSYIRSVMQPRRDTIDFESMFS